MIEQSRARHADAEGAVAVDARERLWLVGYGTLIALGAAILVLASRALGLV